MDRVKGKTVDLIFDGDSITDGWEGAGLPVWNKDFEPRHAADFGIGGDCTQHVLWRLEHGQLTGLHPKLVAIMIGTNNLFGNTNEQIAEGVTAIVKEYRQRLPDAVVLLQAIFPRGEKPDDWGRAKIKDINAQISKLADGQKVIYIDFGDKFLLPDGTLPRDIMPDGLHPNAKGYEIWSEAIRSEVDKVLGSSAPAQ